MEPKTDTSRPAQARTGSATPTQGGVRALKAAHTQAEAAQNQLQALLALTDTALSHLTLDDLLRELLSRVTTVMGVDQVAILLLDEDDQTLTLRAARGLLEDRVGRVRVTVGQGFPGRIAASREPLIVNDPSASDLPAAPSELQQQARALAGVPLLVEDPVVDPKEGQQESRLVGVLAVGSTAPRRFTEADVQLLQRVADRIALAIDHALVYAGEQTARHRAEAALSRALVSETTATDRAEELHAILETMADGVVVYDAEGRSIRSNRAYHKLFALQRAPANFDTLPAMDRASLLDLRDATGTQLPLARNPVSHALRGEVATGPGMDERARAFDGRELELSTSAAPMRGPDGHVVGAVAVIHDVTEHNRLERERATALAQEEAARAASRRMEAFLAAAAHDLRSPLTSTAGFITLAQAATEQLSVAVHGACPTLAPRVAGAHERIEAARQSAERLTRLLNLLFDTATIQVDRLELNRAPCDLAGLVREQVEAQRVAAPDRTIRLRVPAGGKPVPVEVDADRIGQVVTNFVTNALKYAPPDRPVDVSVEARKDCARVAVRDAGPGIPKAEQAQVWELFHRATGVAPQGDAKQGSLGLGLYISRAIIEAHGGQVGVKSADGKGSTFWFTLPLAGVTPDPALRLETAGDATHAAPTDT